MTDPLKLNQSGLTLLAVLVSVTAFGALFFMILSGLNFFDANLYQNRLLASRDRILAGVRTISSLPPSLRNSMLAADASGHPINPGLLACAGGNPLSSCLNNHQYPLTLYSPIVTYVGSTPSSVTPISAPIGSTTSSMRFDVYGTPCTDDTAACPLLLSTAFKAICGAAPRNPSDPLDPTIFVPQSKCSVADSIEVIYQVQLDPDFANNRPELISFQKTLTGTIFVPVELISGNSAQ